MKISKKIKLRTKNDKTVLIFDPDRDFFHEFNETASQMFLLIKEGKDEGEIVSQLAREYDVNKDVVQRELNDFKKELIKLDIVEE